MELRINRVRIKRSRPVTEIPTDIPADALEVWLRDNRIAKIRRNAFIQLSQCTELQLTVNDISEVELGAFNGFNALMILDLSHNTWSFYVNGLTIC